jgi:Penicillin-insensitive murein endopeptidase
MLSGHNSHQVGLDADIWLTQMPDRTLSGEEREFMSAVNMVREDRLDIDPQVWTPERTELIRTAAEDPNVERIFVNAASRKHYAATHGRTGIGSPRCGHGRDTIITSTSVFTARPIVRNASRNRRRSRAMVAGMNSTTLGDRPPKMSKLDLREAAVRRLQGGIAASPRDIGSGDGTRFCRGASGGAISRHRTGYSREDEGARDFHCARPKSLSGHFRPDYKVF